MIDGFWVKRQYSKKHQGDEVKDFEKHIVYFLDLNALL